MMHQRGGQQVFTEMGGHPEINGCCLTKRPDIFHAPVGPFLISSFPSQSFHREILLTIPREQRVLSSA